MENKFYLHVKDMNTLPKIVDEKEKKEFTEKYGEEAWFRSSLHPILTTDTLKEAYHVQEGWMLAKAIFYTLYKPHYDKLMETISKDDYRLEDCIK